MSAAAGVPAGRAAVKVSLLPNGEDYIQPPPLKPHVEASVRSASLRIYLHDSEDYDACCQLVCYGDKGWLHSITGAGFYLALDQVIDKARSFGVKSLAGYVTAAHARLAKRMAEKSGIGFTLGEAGLMDGHALVWAEWQI